MRRFLKMVKNTIWWKILKTIFKVLLWGLELLIIFLAIVIVTQRVSNNQKSFLGFRIFNVATGSMEPEYAVGDILISKEKDPEDIKIGENIVYLGKEGGYEGKIITHNVIEIEQNEKGEYLFHTKGRANTVEDPIVNEDQLYGTIVYNNKLLAFICKILTNRYGLYFFVIIPIILYAFIEFIKVQGQKMEEERERRRREQEKRAHKPKRKTIESEAAPIKKHKKIEEPEEIEQDEEKEVKPSKTKKTTTKKKDVNTDLETDEAKPKKSSSTKSSSKKEKNIEQEEKVKTEKKAKIETSSNAEKEVEEVKKTPRKKQSKDK